ncbi:MAG TPA: hypothetical protein PLU30_08865 [Verrucomicrobiae bacterium]|nr:hypothetical protein [Verrucomicrobiae bacterium]
MKSSGSGSAVMGGRGAIGGRQGHPGFRPKNFSTSATRNIRLPCLAPGNRMLTDGNRPE